MKKEIQRERNEMVYLLLFVLAYALEAGPKVVLRLLNIPMDITLVSSFGIIATIFIIKAGLIESNEENLTVNNVFLNFNGKTVVNFLVAAISVKLIMLLTARVPLVGFVLMIFIALKLVFVPYIIIDQKLSFLEGIAESFKITKGYIWTIIVKYIIIILIAAVIGFANFYIIGIIMGENMNMFAYALMATTNKLPVGLILWESFVNSIFTIAITFYFVNLYKSIMLDNNK